MATDRSTGFGFGTTPSPMQTTRASTCQSPRRCCFRTTAAAALFDSSNKNSHGVDLSGAQLGVIQEEHQRHAQAGDMQPELRRRKGRPSSSSKQDRGHERRACRCRGRGAIGAERPAGDHPEQDDHAREAARPARVRDVALCCYCCMNKVTSRWCTNKKWVANLVSSMKNET